MGNRGAIGKWYCSKHSISAAQSFDAPALHSASNESRERAHLDCVPREPSSEPSFVSTTSAKVPPIPWCNRRRRQPLVRCPPGLAEDRPEQDGLPPEHR